MGSEIKAKATVKDSVFTHLFRDKKYLLQLYKALYENDSDIKEDDLKIITIDNVLTNNIYNDLGFLAREKLLILVESQSKWSVNIAYRMLLYLVQSLRNYVEESGQSMHSNKRIILPEPEMYIIYTGDDANKGDYITFSGEHYGSKKINLDFKINIIRDGKNNDIIAQYVMFTKVYNEQFKLYGPTKKAIEETIRICKDKNVLREYLLACEREVITIMKELFDDEWILNDYGRGRFMEGREEGIINSIKSLMKNMSLGINQALEALSIPQNEWEKYTKLVS